MAMSQAKVSTAHKINGDDSGAQPGFAQEQLRALVERIERMEAEKAAIAADIKEIYAEAKGNGFDTKILRRIVNIRKQDPKERAEQDALLDLYMQALGMIPASDGG
jgi:uncharacterized protein (UPF0335 family)